MEKEYETLIQNTTEAEKTIEAENKPRVTFVFRGDNSYLRFLADSLAKEGYDIDVRSIEPSDFFLDECLSRKPNEKAEALIKNIAGGKIVTDYTLEPAIREITGERAINAYWCLEEEDWKSKENITETLRPIIKEIREGNRIPVVLQDHLGDHIGSMPFFKKKEQIKKLEQDVPMIMHAGTKERNLNEWDYKDRIKGNAYSAVLNQELNIPVITLDDFHGDDVGDSNIIKSLEKLGIQSKDAVLLVDHHIDTINRIWERKIFIQFGFDEVEIVPICPCCVGQKQIMVDRLITGGFRIYPLEYQHEINEKVINNLKQKLEPKNN